MTRGFESREAMWLTMMAQGRMRPDLERILEYGRDHPDEWGGARFNGPYLRVSFTAHVEEHAAALEAVVDNFDKLEFETAPRSEAALHAIRAEIQPLMTRGGPIVGLGEGYGHVHVALNLRGEALAAELLARYRNALRLVLGNFPYPMPANPEFRRAHLGPATVELPNVELEAVLDETEVSSGDVVKGKVCFTNRGDESIGVGTDEPLGGVVTLPGTDEIVGRYGGPVAGTGLGFTFGPGEVREVACLVGTASVDPTIGYRLPPGDSEVVVLVPQYGHDPSGAFAHQQLLTPPVPLRLT